MKLRFLDTIQQAYDKALQVEKDIGDINAVIFSDHHRGTGDRADDYRFSTKTYENALDHYYRNGAMLVLLGDVEELWENSKRNVLAYYNDIMKKEQEFDKEDRYFRIWGNHDSDWKSNKEAQKFLGLKGPVYESVRIHITDKGEDLGNLFLIHGHQGSVFSDQLARLSKFFVRFFWRFFQRIFNKPLDTPATNSKMRSRHDLKYYTWARKHNHDLIVITGHSHEPVFNSFTYADRLRVELARLGVKEQEGTLTREEFILLTEVRSRIDALKKHDSTFLNPEGSAVPCYFNTGCCSFSDGEITAIEIMDREIRLVKWRRDGTKKVIQEESLQKIFELLRLNSSLITDGI